MNQDQASRRRGRKRIGLLALSLPGLVVTAVVIGDQVRVHLWRAAIGNADAAVRTRALYEVAAQRERRAADAVFAVLETEQDRAVLEAAGYAAMRIGDPRGVPLLQRRAEESPDDYVRAQLTVYACRLSGRDVRLIDWLTPGLDSPEPWRRVGSAVGLLELGRLRGGCRLIDMTPELEPQTRGYAIRELRRVAEPMAETVGWPHDWSPDGEGRLDDAKRADLRKFWKRHATITLLNDVLTRLERRSRKWHEVDRLLHARDRVATWFQ